MWQVSLRQAPSDLSGLETLLARPELERAAAFRLPAPRRQFIVARVALRLLLARHLGAAPSSFVFTTGPHGKPALQPPSALRFNVSHAGDLVLVALARDVEVGVDVEVHRRSGDLDSLAASILCAEDLALWRAAAATERAAVFYRTWTCKEAVAKAIGNGLALDFKALRIALCARKAATVLAVAPGFGPAEAWALHELQVEDGYSAAVAAATPALRVTQYALPLWLASAAPPAVPTI